jgi:hypothetical protein
VTLEAVGVMLRELLHLKISYFTIIMSYRTDMVAAFPQYLQRPMLCCNISKNKCTNKEIGVISMQASYISYFGENRGLGQSKLVCQLEVVAGSSNTVVNVKKASYPKIRREKSKVLVAEESELFSQYKLDL